MNWEPTKSDLAWTRNLWNVIRVGGVYGMPITQSTFRKDSDKQITMVMGDPDDEGNQRFIKATCLVGFRVITPEGLRTFRDYLESGEDPPNPFES
jgi:hypothetical protein